MIYENINRNLSKSISTTIENYDRSDTTIDSTSTDEQILEFGRETTQYYKNTLLKRHRKEIANGRYNSISFELSRSTSDLTKSSQETIFNQDNIICNPLNIKVVNISTKNLTLQYGQDVKTVIDWVNLNRDNHIYIGKEMKGLVTGTMLSDWTCRFRCSKNISRAEMCCNYELYIRQTPHLWDKLSSLEGKILGCTCSNRYDRSNPHNFLCHGLVLRYLAYAKHYNTDDGGAGLYPKKYSKE